MLQQGTPLSRGSTARRRLRRLTLWLCVPACLGLWWADGYARGEAVLALALTARAYCLERRERRDVDEG
jgi:hypothetical protein